jgi:hypothetical protein
MGGREKPLSAISQIFHSFLSMLSVIGKVL